MKKPRMTMEKLAVLINKGFSTMQDMINGLTVKVNGVEIRLNNVETRLERVETKVDSVETRLERVETKVDRALYVEYINLEGRVTRLEKKPGPKTNK